MHYRLRCSLSALLFTVLAAPAGCGDGSNRVAIRDDDGEGVEVITLTVEPDKATKLVGQTQRYTAIARDEEGGRVDVSKFMTWSSSDEDIATIDRTTGVARARAAGSVVISAVANNVVDTAELVVIDEDEPNGAGGATGTAGAAGEPATGGGAPGAAGEPATSGGESGVGGAPDDGTPVTRIYVSNLGGEGVVPSIRVFDLGADGDVAPVASFVGEATTLSGPSQMAIVGGELFVANGEGKGILVFDIDAPGNVAPTRAIVGDNTTFTPFSPMGLVVRGDSIVVSHQSTGLLLFPKSGSGDLAPSAKIGPTFFYAAHLASSPVANEILVAVPSPSSEVHGYLQTAGAADPPLRVLKPGFAWVRGVTSTPSAIFAAAAGSTGVSDVGGVAVFAHDAATNAGPIRAIAGTETGLDDPHGISVYGDEIFVANQSEHAVRVFDIEDDGNVPALRVIEGAATNLRFPAGILVATTGG